MSEREEKEARDRLREAERRLEEDEERMDLSEEELAERIERARRAMDEDG